MNNDPRFDNLTDGELEEISGGMTCSQGLVAGSVYQSLSTIYGTLGMTSSQAQYAGMASGVYKGACS